MPFLSFITNSGKALNGLRALNISRKVTYMCFSFINWPLSEMTIECHLPSMSNTSILNCEIIRMSYCILNFAYVCSNLEIMINVYINLTFSFCSILVYYFTPVSSAEYWDEYVCICVCVCLCLSLYLLNIVKHTAELQQLFCSYVAYGCGLLFLWQHSMHYVLPILWMMSCFHLMGYRIL